MNTFCCRQEGENQLSIQNNLLISSKNDLFTSSGRLKSYSDEIWVYLSDCLENKMTANNIYIYSFV